MHSTGKDTLVTQLIYVSVLMSYGCVLINNLIYLMLIICRLIELWFQPLKER